MRYSVLWPTQHILRIDEDALNRRWLERCYVAVNGDAISVALLSVALTEVSGQEMIYSDQRVPGREHRATIQLRLLRNQHGRFYHLITSRKLNLSMSQCAGSGNPFRLYHLALGADPFTLSSHPRLRWRQEPKRWYLCLDTAEGTLYRHLREISQMPCVFYQTQTGGLTYFHASASQGFRRNFLTAEPLQWRAAAGLPNAHQIPKRVYVPVEDRGLLNGALLRAWVKAAKEPEPVIPIHDGVGHFLSLLEQLEMPNPFARS